MEERGCPSPSIGSFWNLGPPLGEQPFLDRPYVFTVQICGIAHAMMAELFSPEVESRWDTAPTTARAAILSPASAS